LISFAAINQDGGIVCLNQDTIALSDIQKCDSCAGGVGGCENPIAIFKGFATAKNGNDQ
jgi:hypothetical protein